MTASQQQELRRLAFVAARMNLETAADLDRFLDEDPKTAADPQARARLRAGFQQAVPKLRDAVGS